MIDQLIASPPQTQETMLRRPLLIVGGTFWLRSALLSLFLGCVTPLAVSGQAATPLPGTSTTAGSHPDQPPIPYAPIDPSSIPHINFDVATFKLNKTGGPNPLQVPADGDGFTAQNRPIHDLLRYAFSRGRGGTYQISGQPRWVDQDHYDIHAKVAPEDIAKWKSLDALGKRLAFQGFLIEYLKLKFHPDGTPRPYYALLIAKNGPKMKEAQTAEEYKDSHGQPVARGTLSFPTASDAVGYGCEMERLADMLTGHADHPVLDETGLRHFYDFTLHFDGAADPNNANAPEIPFLGLPPNLATSSILSAVHELGLELKPMKGPLDGMVIDHIERPPND